MRSTTPTEHSRSTRQHFRSPQTTRIKTYGQTASFAGAAFTAIGLVGGDTISSVTETSPGAAATPPVGTDTIVPKCRDVRRRP